MRRIRPAWQVSAVSRLLTLERLIRRRPTISRFRPVSIPQRALPGAGASRPAPTHRTIYINQLTTAGLTWNGFMEAMPSACDPQSSGTNSSSHDEYSNGHNPISFYTDISAAECQADDIGVSDLTA